jgi:DNA primase catalytic core
MDLVQKYENEILPSLSQHFLEIFSSLSPIDKGGHYICVCPNCGAREAFIYKNSDLLVCNRKNKCGHSVSVISHLNGGSLPRGKSYVDIIKKLCEMTGVEFPEREYTNIDLETFAKRDQQQQLLNDFEFISIEELRSSAGAKARDYLNKRGVSAEEMYAVGFGFYTDKDNIKQALARKNHLPSEIDESGLLRDDWKGRLIFPIKERGIIGDFVARDVTGTAPKERKYLRMNGDKAPDNGMLIGLDRAEKNIIFVEGVFDHLALERAGIKNSAPLGGSNLWDKHIEKLHRHKVKTITLLFDGDEAGVKGTSKIIEKLLDTDINVFVVDPKLLKSSDPDEFVIAYGADAVVSLLQDKVHGHRWLARHIAHNNKSGLWKDYELVSALEEAQKFEEKNKYRTQAMDFFWEEFASITPISPDVLDRCRQTIQEKRSREEKKKLLQHGSQKILMALAADDSDTAKTEVIRLSDDLKKQADQENGFGFLLENNSEERLIEDFKTAAPSIETGYVLGDGVPLAFPSGGLSLICGSTGHGKTTMLINCSLGALDKNSTASIYFLSYEEERKKIIAKFINTYSDMELNKGNNKGAIYHFFHAQGNKSLDPFKYFNKYNKDLAQGFLKAKNDFFDRYMNNGRLRIVQRDMSAEELVDAIKFIKDNDNNTALIVIDYVQKLYLNHSNYNARYEAIKEICKLLENCAIETGLPIVLGAQFNKTIVSEELVRSSGQYNVAEGHDIARTAVNMYGLWNRSHNPTNSTNEIFITVIKGRDSGSGHDMVFEFDGNTGKIKNHISYLPAVEEPCSIKSHPQQESEKIPF